MKQKTRIASKLFAALVVLTLISCCFLGTTMARYTSAGTGTATVGVAKWDIDASIQTVGEGDYNFGKLSPSSQGYFGRQTPNCENTTSKAHVATIENKGEVDAYVSVKPAESPEYTLADGAQFIADPVNIYNWTEDQLCGQGVSKDQADELFSINMYYWDGTKYIPINASSQLKVPVGDTLYIWAEVTWTTWYSNSESEGVLEDAIDTWMGENCTALSWSFSYTAVQASELPA